MWKSIIFLKYLYILEYFFHATEETKPFSHKNEAFQKQFEIRVLWDTFRSCKTCFVVLCL